MAIEASTTLCGCQSASVTGDALQAAKDIALGVGERLALLKAATSAMQEHVPTHTMDCAMASMFERTSAASLVDQRCLPAAGAHSMSTR